MKTCGRQYWNRYKKSIWTRSYDKAMFCTGATLNNTNAKHFQESFRGVDAREENGRILIKATKVGAMANFTLAMSKLIAGFGCGSSGLLADAFASCGDLLTDAVVYYAVKESRKAPTAAKPWGQGKIEPLGALTVGCLLVTSGIGVGYSSLGAALAIAPNLVSEHIPIIGEAINAKMALAGSPATFEVPEVVKHGVDPEGTSWMVALAICAGSMAVKEKLFRYTLNAGQKAMSSVVIANAWQHRSDVGVSFAVGCGIVGSICGYPIFDCFAGLLISGMIVKQGVEGALSAIQELTDINATAAEIEEFKNTCLEIGGVKNVFELTARKSGPFVFIECTIGVAGVMSASSAHRIAELIRKELLQRFPTRVAGVLCHVRPLGAYGLGENIPPDQRDYVYVKRVLHNNLLLVDNSPAVQFAARKSVAQQLDLPPTYAHLDMPVSYYLSGISEIQLYYFDNGYMGIKVDVYMIPEINIQEAHFVAKACGQTIRHLLPYVKEVDVDLELNEIRYVQKSVETTGDFKKRWTPVPRDKKEI